MHGKSPLKGLQLQNDPRIDLRQCTDILRQVEESPYKAQEGKQRDQESTMNSTY